MYIWKLGAQRTLQSLSLRTLASFIVSFLSSLCLSQEYFPIASRTFTSLSSFYSEPLTWRATHFSNTPLTLVIFAIFLKASFRLLPFSISFFFLSISFTVSLFLVVSPIPSSSQVKMMMSSSLLSSPLSSRPSWCVHLLLTRLLSLQ